MRKLVGFQVRRDLIVGRGLRRPVEASKTRRETKLGKTAQVETQIEHVHEGPEKKRKTCYADVPLA
jgi:hypothetical protein